MKKKILLSFILSVVGVGMTTADTKCVSITVPGENAVYLIENTPTCKYVDVDGVKCVGWTVGDIQEPFLVYPVTETQSVTVEYADAASIWSDQVAGNYSLKATVEGGKKGGSTSQVFSETQDISVETSAKGGNVLKVSLPAAKCGTHQMAASELNEVTLTLSEGKYNLYGHGTVTIDGKDVEGIIQAGSYFSTDLSEASIIVKAETDNSEMTVTYTNATPTGISQAEALSNAPKAGKYINGKKVIIIGKDGKKYDLAGKVINN